MISSKSSIMLDTITHTVYKLCAMETAPTDTITARLPVDTIERIRAEAARRDWSRSQTVARTIEIGLAQLEAQVALPFAEGAAS